ncbi:hypothetical protein [Stappia stellulata]|uniref:hypothetical protein n=1 Tax=Stappia stellulata TaxID=71235 RepID=UPI0012EB4018|nr:hypothetical protein [Stappia stellulata]
MQTPEQKIQNGKSLFDSLLDSGWEKYNFGYNGPFPPYIKIGLKWSLDGPSPCFSSMTRDRIIFRSKTKISKHFSSFREIKMSRNAMEDIFGKKSAEFEYFPTDIWLTLGEFSLTKQTAWDPLNLHTVHLPLPVLSVAGEVYLR